MRKRVFLGLAFMVLALGASRPVLAVQPDEILPDAQLEQRARKISSGLRCMVCQNQSIDDSDASLAKDLRVLVRDHLKAGESDGQIRDYLVARYGNFILLKPPFEWDTALLWLSPFIFLGLGAAAILGARRSAVAEATPAPLSAEEAQKLKDLLDEGGKKPAQG